MAHDNIKLRKLIVRQIRSTVIALFRFFHLHLLLYKSWWHMIFTSPRKKNAFERNYLTVRPNALKSISHQVYNWASGLYFAKEFGLRFAHTRFPDMSWDTFLGLGEKFVSARQLRAREGYRTVRMPGFKPENPDPLKLIRKIIASYADKRVVFILENDQKCNYCSNLVMDVRRFFNEALCRKDEKLIFETECTNIVIYIPGFGKGEIYHKGKKTTLVEFNTQLDFFKQTIHRLKELIPAERNPRFYIFSRANEGRLADFKNMGENVLLCLRTSERYVMLHMIRAQLLVFTNSDFAWLAATIGTGSIFTPNINKKYHIDPERILESLNDFRV